MTFKECKQYKCCFRSRPDDCPICPECGAEPCVVDADGTCVNCYACENDEGYVRRGLSKNQQKAAKMIANVLKEQFAEEEGVMIITSPGDEQQ